MLTADSESFASVAVIAANHRLELVRDSLAAAGIVLKREGETSTP